MTKEIIYILDCDGVILDSNMMKVEAMSSALKSFNLFMSEDIQKALDNFKNNFGMSRYWHVEKFKNILKNTPSSFTNECLDAYAKIVREKYAKSALCEGIQNFLQKDKSKKFIVSGSDQVELNTVFKKRELDSYFELILGSPVSKVENIASIVSNDFESKFVFIGDSQADLNAAVKNKIDFIFYTPYSLAQVDFEAKVKLKNFRILKSWKDL